MEEANKLKEKGNQEYKNSKFTSAIGFYTQALALYQSEVYYINRASCYLNLEQFQKAESDCKAGLNINPKYIKGYIRLSEILIRKGDFINGRQVLLDGKTQCTQNIDLNREIDRSAILLNYKDTYVNDIKENNFKDALRKINTILEKCIMDQIFYQDKVRVLCLSNSPKEAETFVNSLLIRINKLKPGLGFYLLAETLVYQCKLSEAKTNLTKSINNDQGFKNAHEALKIVDQMENAKKQASAAFTSKKFEDAIVLYSNAKKLAKDNRQWSSVMSSNIASCYMSLNKKKEALDSMTESVSLDDSNGKFWYKKGKLEKDLGDPESAEKSMIKAKNLDSTLNIDHELKALASKVKSMNKKDYYGTLGLKKEATPEQIKKAYKELVRKWHPDKHTSDEAAKEKADKKFKEINEAYSILNDPKKKQQYDLMGPDQDFNSGFNSGSYSDMFSGGSGGIPVNQIFQMFFDQGSQNSFSFSSGGSNGQRGSNPFGDMFGAGSQFRRSGKR